MINQIDNIYHITDFEKLKIILREGFKPSYTNEVLGERQLLIPMISFSNVLLRDIGKDEVMNYGEAGIGFSRKWAITKKLNPVIYTYENGEAEKALINYIENSLFLSKLKKFKDHFEKWEKNQNGKFSDTMSLTSTTTEALALVDYAVDNYNEELIEILSNFSNSIFQATKQIIFLTKQYIVKNKEKNNFIAYNDREWRKTYLDLEFYTDLNEEEFNYWVNLQKPHFNEEDYRLRFEIKEVSAILIRDRNEQSEIISLLQDIWGEEATTLLETKQLLVDTKDNLIKCGL